MVEWVSALSPVISALIGVISYATLTNYRLDRLDEQVKRISAIEETLNKHDKRITLLEAKNEKQI